MCIRDRIRRPNREVRPLRKDMGAGARGLVGRAHPISKSDKPASRDKDCRARGRDDKARLRFVHSVIIGIEFAGFLRVFIF